MDNSNMFTVTPMSKRIELNAGDVYEGDIIVANPANAKEDFYYKVGVSAYNVVGEEYSADFLTETERSQIVDWITIDNPTGMLHPNESVKVHYKVTVPETAPAGGQYAAFMISSNAEASPDNNIAINNIFEMASILYAKIEGDTIREGEILGSSIPGFVTEMPVVASATFKNDGNVHEVARIALEVRNVLSPGIIYPGPGETGAIEEIIMPGTTRYVTRNIDNVSSLGVYEITQTINYMGESEVLHKVVVSCPIWFMVLVLITVASIIASIVSMAKKRRARKQVF